MVSSIKLSTGRVARWSLLLQSYTFTVHPQPGAQNQETDALSRRHYEPQDEGKPDKVPFTVASLTDHS